MAYKQLSKIGKNCLREKLIYTMEFTWGSVGYYII